MFLITRRARYIIFLAVFESTKFSISSLVSFVTCYSFKSTLFIWQWDDSACDMSWLQSLGLMWLWKEGIDSSVFPSDIHMCTVVCMPLYHTHTNNNNNLFKKTPSVNLWPPQHLHMQQHVQTHTVTHTQPIHTTQTHIFPYIYIMLQKNK